MVQLEQIRQAKQMKRKKTVRRRKLMRAAELRERKTKREIIEDRAYMILSDIAFDYEEIDGKLFLTVTDLNSLRHKAFFAVRENDFMYLKGNMSKENMYKVMFIVEKNKEMLMGGLKCHTIQEIK